MAISGKNILNLPHNKKKEKIVRIKKICLNMMPIGRGLLLSLNGLLCIMEYAQYFCMFANPYPKWKPIVYGIQMMNSKQNI